MNSKHGLGTWRASVTLPSMKPMAVLVGAWYWPRTAGLWAGGLVSQGWRHKRGHSNPGRAGALLLLRKIVEASASRRSPQLRAGDDFISGLLEAMSTPAAIVFKD